MTTSRKHILVLDEGTTSTRAVLFDDRGTAVDSVGLPLEVTTGAGGIVEQSAQEILDHSVSVLRTVVSNAERAGREISGLAIASQRATTVLWDRETGAPAAPVIVWQDSRCAQLAEDLAHRSEEYHETCGTPLIVANLTLHLRWLLQDPKLRRRAEAGTLAAGGPESWMVWNLTGGPQRGNHLSVMSVAQPSGGVRLATHDWWAEWFEEMGVPLGLMGTLVKEDADFGTTNPDLIGASLPIVAVIGDQLAALHGHGAVQTGEVKCTYGTGSFVDFNIGPQTVVSPNGLLFLTGDVNMIEAASYTAGSGIEWLIDDVGLLESAGQLDATYAQADPASSVVFVPMLAGFGAPQWDPEARGLIVGLDRGTSRADIVRAMVDGIAQSVTDLVDAIANVAGTAPGRLYVDGGLANSDALLQMQADLLGIPVERAADAGVTTARGAAWLGGVKAGVWADEAEAIATRRPGRVFEPAVAPEHRERLRAAWRDAVDRALGWRPAAGPTN